MNPEDKKMLIHRILETLFDLNDANDYDDDDLHECIVNMKRIDFEHAKKHGYGLWDKEGR